VRGRGRSPQRKDQVLAPPIQILFCFLRELCFLKNKKIRCQEVIVICKLHELLPILLKKKKDAFELGQEPPGSLMVSAKNQKLHCFSLIFLYEL
jgi:hypothetical protein